MEKKVDFFTSIFGENYPSFVEANVDNNSEDNVEDILQSELYEHSSENSNCVDNVKEFCKQTLLSKVDKPIRKRKKNICLTLDDNIYDFYSSIAQSKNVKLQKVINQILIAFQNEITKD